MKSSGGGYWVSETLVVICSFCTGSPLDSRPTTPLPDRNLLVFILDRLQKKDTHAIFSKPVNPNEVFAILLDDPQQILMVNVAVA
ncbi:hypothetical protein HanXRQr2_Chr16g0731291 [Helianthus annuus]|uniref:Uncharacterized protein n=1 Tax=Helianthus annuus TaxID=4232 RepID=A0A251S178_HELAN|nr:uncharacterized protein LOC110916928 isoform X1 [Helianthus annuus]KAF5758621.1 hypothetical protein HanXRQr2_Chr16g0731291 [Helianthus annuus]KAJ0436935.1 hypothetical protein HanHA300_Chr16g0596201 [Helianthus annuus]KAJ0459247.1 hypothetical protein HanHA89_Chr16g0646691 [Helianthus annuus]